MKNTMLIPLIAALGLSGCTAISDQISLSKLFTNAYTTQQIQTMTGTKLYAVKNPDLCAAYYQNKPPQIKTEINRRGLITDGQWDDINNGSIDKGMNLCSVLAAKGKPNSLVMGKSFLELDYTNQTVQLVKTENGVYQVSMK